jgi:hypothetical protein
MFVVRLDASANFRANQAPGAVDLSKQRADCSARCAAANSGVQE